MAAVDPGPVLADRDGLAVHPDVIHQMLRVTAFAETVGAVERRDEIGWDPGIFREALRGLGRLGVNHHVAQLSFDQTTENLAKVAAAALAAIEASPNPDAEWEPMAAILGDQLPGLVGISASSVSRYQSGHRTTPDRVADRLHVLTQIVADLSGSYNDFGIRRWFDRRRKALDGRAPGEILSGAWDPDSGEVMEVRELAQRLLGAAVA